LINLEAQVSRGNLLSVVAPPFGYNGVRIIATTSGSVISLPLIHEGDTLFHIARFKDVDEVVESIETFTETLATPEALNPEPPII